MEGLLEVRSKTGTFSKFKPRFCVLSDFTLRVFKTDRITLMEFFPIEGVRVTEGKSPERFEVVWEKRELEIKAGSSADKFSWAEAIQNQKELFEANRKTTRAVSSILLGSKEDFSDDGVKHLLKLAKLAEAKRLVEKSEKSFEKLQQLVKNFPLKDQRKILESFLLNYEKAVEQINEEVKTIEKLRNLIHRELSHKEEFAAVGKPAEKASKDFPRQTKTEENKHDVSDSFYSVRNQTFSENKAQPDSSFEFVQNPLVRKIVRQTQVFKKYPVGFAPQPNRANLPVLVHPDQLKINIWAIVKKFIGKELTKVSLPVQLCEPLSGLQKTCGWTGQKRLLDLTARCADPGLRMSYVTSLLLMELYTFYVRMKKPFNPFLGETYELVEEDMRLVMEQVSHHPPVSAFHADADSFTLQGTFAISVKMKLTGPTMEIHQPVELLLKPFGEVYKWNPPSPRMHNILIGKMYGWFHDPLEVSCSSGLRSRVEFLPKNSDPSCDFRIKGTVADRSGRVLYELDGRWDREVFAVSKQTGDRTLLNKRPPEIPNWDKQFFFDSHTVNLNHLTADMLRRLAPTDSRLRPDVRAMEHGDLPLAEAEKERLEEKQRARRKLMEQSHSHWKPQYFDKQEDSFFDWKFNGSYWRFRESGNWPTNQFDLFTEFPVTL